MSETPVASNPPLITAESVVIMDEVDDRRFYADFRDRKDSTRTPFDPARGCHWSVRANDATIFSNEEEARRALAARQFANTKRLRFVRAEGLVGKA
ncbi:MAG: hypothetical protein SFV32_14390 [Opitutaceae bacterium]|nr:hypothetical protein [Opitutaceae bacterium]